jgi:hypothetical protein
MLQERLPGLLQEIRRGVVRSLGINPMAVIPLEQQAIPRTEIGKIRRAELRNRFEAGAFDRILERLAEHSQRASALGQARLEPKTEIEEVIATLWCDVLCLDGVDATMTFFELGAIRCCCCSSSGSCRLASRQTSRSAT